MIKMECSRCYLGSREISDGIYLARAFTARNFLDAFDEDDVLCVINNLNARRGFHNLGRDLIPEEILLICGFQP